MRGHKWRRHISQAIFMGRPFAFCILHPFDDEEERHFIPPESISSYPDYPEGFCKTCVERYEQAKKEGKI